MCVAYSNQKNLSTSIVRLSRVFGPTMNPDSTLSLSQFINSGLNKSSIVLKSDGMQNYSYNYVGDAVTAIIKVLLDGENCEAYNVSDDNFNCRLRDFAELVSRWSGQEVIFDIPSELEKKGFSNSIMTILDSSKLKKLNWYCIDNIETKINDTLDILE
jgi:nucleoside-diphosphate-sugar epimerase